MALVNSQIASGLGLPTGSSGGVTQSANALTVTQDPNVGWVPTSIDSSSIVLAAAGLGTVNGADRSNTIRKGLYLFIDITALTGTAPTLTVSVQAKDPASGKYVTILASAALAAVATTMLQIYPGLLAAANLTANAMIPTTWRISYTVGGSATPTVTATIGATLVV